MYSCYLFHAWVTAVCFICKEEAREDYFCNLEVSFWDGTLTFNGNERDGHRTVLVFWFFFSLNMPSHCSVFRRLISVPLNRLLRYSPAKKNTWAHLRNAVFVSYKMIQPQLTPVKEGINGVTALNWSDCNERKTDSSGEAVIHLNGTT